MVCSHYLSPSPFPAKARDGDARPELEALIRVWGYGVEGLGFRCSGFRGLGFRGLGLKVSGSLIASFSMAGTWPDH